MEAMAWPLYTRVARIEGHGLRCGRQCLVSVGWGWRLELLPADA